MMEWVEPPIDFENNTPTSLGDCSREAYLASNWIIAIDAWDYCDPSILTKMLNRHPIPFELQPIIANIISGARKPNKRGAAKLKIPAGHRLIIAGIYSELKESFIDATIKRRTLHDYHDKADKLRLEPVELLRAYQQKAKEFKQEWAEGAGISSESLENIVESLQKKLKNYPHI